MKILLESGSSATIRERDFSKIIWKHSSVEYISWDGKRREIIFENEKIKEIYQEIPNIDIKPRNDKIQRNNKSLSILKASKNPTITYPLKKEPSKHKKLRFKLDSMRREFNYKIKIITKFIDDYNNHSRDLSISFSELAQRIEQTQETVDRLSCPNYETDKINLTLINNSKTMELQQTYDGNSIRNTNILTTETISPHKVVSPETSDKVKHINELINSEQLSYNERYALISQFEFSTLEHKAADISKYLDTVKIEEKYKLNQEAIKSKNTWTWLQKFKHYPLEIDASLGTKDMIRFPLNEKFEANPLLYYNFYEFQHLQWCKKGIFSIQKRKYMFDDDEINKNEGDDEALLKEADIIREEGNKRLAIGQLDSAILLYTISLDTFPTAKAANNRALVALKKKQWSNVLHDCRIAIWINPKDPKALLRGALAYEGLGLIPECLATIYSALIMSEYENSVEKEHDRIMTSYLMDIRPKLMTSYLDVINWKWTVENDPYAVLYDIEQQPPRS